MKIFDTVLIINFVFAIIAFFLIKNKGYSFFFSLVISLFLGFFAFIISFFLKRNADSSLSARKPDSRKGTTKVSARERSVKISVSQHAGISKPLHHIIENILSDAEIMIDLNADSSLFIEVKATPQSGIYGFKGSTQGETYYTGAEVSGTITYHDPGMKRKISKSFLGNRNLPESVVMSSFNKNPNAAPINEAFNDSGFFPILIRTLRELYGTRILLAALKSEHYHISWLEEIKDQEAIGVYIQASGSDLWRVREHAVRLLDKISPKWREKVVPVYSKKLISGPYAARKTAASVLSAVGWNPTGETEEMSFWLASGRWSDFEKAGTSANQFLISSLGLYDPLKGEKDEIESFVNAITTLTRMNRHTHETLIADLNAAHADRPFGTLLLLSSLKDETASDQVNALIMNAAKEDRAKYFSILELVAWEPVKEAGAWYWIEKKEWEKAGALGKTAVRPLLDYIFDGNRGKYEKTKAAAALGLTGDITVIPEIIALARTAEWDVSKALTSAAVALEPENPEYQMINHLSHGNSEKCTQLGEEVVDWLIPEIHDDKWRFHAIRALGEIGGSHAVEALINLLNDKKSLDRHSSAVNALGNTGDQAAARHLIPWLIKSNFNDRNMAARALAKIKDPDTVVDILNLLKSEDLGVQLDAVVALGWKGNHQAVQPLVELLKSSEAAAKKQVFESLIAIGLPSLKNTFLDQLSDPDPAVQFMAARALIEMGWEPDRKSTPPVYWAAKGDWGKCREYGSQAVPALIEAWKLAEKDQSYPSTYPYTAQKEPLTELDQILVGLEPDSVPPLIEIFKENRRLRFPLMRVFIGLKEASAEPLLILSAQTNDTDIRSVASHILRFGDHSIIFALQKLTTHPEKIVRQSAMKVLGWHPDPSSVEPILKTLFQEEDHVVRGVGVETLGIIGGKAAVGGLIKALDDPSDHVRIVAAKALAKLGDPASTETLISLLQDEDYNFVIQAIKGLGKIGTSQAKQALEQLEESHESSFIKNEIIEAKNNMNLE